MAGLRLELDPSGIVRGGDIAESALERVATQAAQTEGSLSRVGTRGAPAVTALGRSFSSIQPYQISNVANQVGDFATQVGAGTSASQALGQQLPQLLGGFGAVGAVAGAVAAFGIPLFRIALQNLGAEATDLEDTMDSLEGAIGDLRSANKAAATDIDDLREDYGQYAEQIRDTIRAEQELAAFRAQQELRTALGDITQVAGGFDLSGVTAGDLADPRGSIAAAEARLIEIFETLGGIQELSQQDILDLEAERGQLEDLISNLQDIPRQMQGLADDLGITTEAATQFAAQMQAATDAETADQQAQAFAAMRTILAEAGAELGNMSDQGVILTEAINTAETAAIELAAIEMANLSRAANNAERIRDALASVSVPNVAVGGLLPNAHGNAFFGGNIIPFARGGVVSSPTLFGMAGASTGLMGEAGPEAILPLVRGPNGDLGVQAFGGSGGGSFAGLTGAQLGINEALVQGIELAGMFGEAVADAGQEVEASAEDADRAFEQFARKGGSAIDRLIAGQIDLKDAIAQTALEFIKMWTMRNLVNSGFAQEGDSIGTAIFRGLFGGFFDGGGTIGMGQSGIVGEYGPEFVRATSSGAVVTSRVDTDRRLRAAPPAVEVIGGDLTLTDDGKIAAQIRVAAVQSRQGAVADVRGSLATWQGELQQHGALV